MWVDIRARRSEIPQSGEGRKIEWRMENAGLAVNIITLKPAGTAYVFGAGDIHYDPQKEDREMEEDATLEYK